MHILEVETDKSQNLLRCVINVVPSPFFTPCYCLLRLYRSLIMLICGPPYSEILGTAFQINVFYDFILDGFRNNFEKSPSQNMSHLNFSTAYFSAEADITNIVNFV